MAWRLTILIVSRSLPQSLHANTGIVPEIKSWLPIHRSSCNSTISVLWSCIIVNQQSEHISGNDLLPFLSLPIVTYTTDHTPCRLNYSRDGEATLWLASWVGWLTCNQVHLGDLLITSHLSSRDLFDDHNSSIREHLFNLLTLKMETVCTSETTATQPTSTGCRLNISNETVRTPRSSKFIFLSWQFDPC
jgi:hypothetical protein